MIAIGATINGSRGQITLCKWSRDNGISCDIVGLVKRLQNFSCLAWNPTSLQLVVDQGFDLLVITFGESEGQLVESSRVLLPTQHMQRINSITWSKVVLF